jgi:hypothetical protein
MYLVRDELVWLELPMEVSVESIDTSLDAIKRVCRISTT